jgi:N-methylhydantoinase B
MGQIIEFVRSDDEAFRLNAAFERIKHPASGRLGGSAGQPGFVGLASGQVLPGKGIHDIAAGERVVMHTPGGGGTGPVADRSRELIALDLLEERISEEAAREIYDYEPQSKTH